MSALTAVLFFGGWHAPWPETYLKGWNPTLASLHGFAFFVIKTILLFLLNSMVRAVVPRYRYDQLMRLGWKVFLPTSLVAVALMGGWRVFGFAP
jgi:NADH-quinone oxidoreductase subunit H